MTNYETEPWDSKLEITNKLYTGTYVAVREAILQENRTPASLHEIMTQRLVSIVINDTELIQQRWNRSIGSLEGVVVRPDGKHKIITHEETPWHRYRSMLTEDSPIQESNASDRITHPQGLIMSVGAYLGIRTHEYTINEYHKHTGSRPTQDNLTDNPYWRHFGFGSDVRFGQKIEPSLLAALQRAGYFTWDQRADTRIQSVYLEVASKLVAERGGRFLPRVYLPAPTNETVFYPVHLGKLDDDTPMFFGDRENRNYIGKIGNREN